jgi:hypothetical protein
MIDRLVARFLRHERPELWEQWEEAGTLPAHLLRIGRIANDLLADSERQLADPTPRPFGTLEQMASNKLLVSWAAWSAVQMATEDDWVEREMSREGRDEAYEAQSAPSGWYSS